MLYAFYKNVTYVSCFIYYTFYSGELWGFCDRYRISQIPNLFHMLCSPWYLSHLVHKAFSNVYCKHAVHSNTTIYKRTHSHAFTHIPGFSAQSIFFSVYIATFNAVWAALPTIAYGIMEQVRLCQCVIGSRVCACLCTVQIYLLAGTSSALPAIAYGIMEAGARLCSQAHKRLCRGHYLQMQDLVLTVALSKGLASSVHNTHICTVSVHNKCRANDSGCAQGTQRTQRSRLPVIATFSTGFLF